MTVRSLPDARWQAVQARDRTSDGRFVYAVRSTGIYCRPSCPSRRPHRNRVEFFDLPALAERAGFRPCHRCQPDSAAINDPSLELAQRVCRLIDERPDGDVRLGRLSAALGMGLTPRQYAASRRLARLKRELRAEETVSRAQFAAGYGSSSRLYERADQDLGMTPATYQRGGVGARIGYTLVDTSLGPLLVAGTERGLCAVRFGDREAALTHGLREEFPEAELVRDDPRVNLWARVVQAQVNGLKPSSLVPLDVQATAFQWRVWRELRRIPLGQRRTYRDIATAIGRPRATRAVARACATNPAAVAIPCHRVVREDGGLGGYRWGVERKQALLERETGNGERET
ncbi:MAG: methylated-DNA--[protein]-cysteine S-methyltransferase [Gemmatimonadetes bacterium]|nr:methylated-DNA--[protein]-cysteine S-methyltransferase [Gemmatimonadota bacterium]